MLSILCVRLKIKVKVGIPESFKVGWYPPQKKKTGSSQFFYVLNLIGIYGSTCTLMNKNVNDDVTIIPPIVVSKRFLMNYSV